MKILILAGGRGTRLWPLSRKTKPKQFQKLISEKTMLQETVSRLLPKYPLKDIFISTNSEYLKEVKSELPEIPKNNIIAEPVSRERVAAILLVMTKLKREDMNKSILVLPSDHLIKDKKGFQEAIISAEKFIKDNPLYIAILAENPTFPDTGLGYIKKGKRLDNIINLNVYQAAFFKEKPNLKRARTYLKTKNYFWNTAVYLFHPSLMETLVREFVPDSYRRYELIKNAVAKKKYAAILQNEYAKMDNVGMEYSIIENYKNVALVPVDIGWSDIGSWTVLKNCLSSPDKNFIRGNYIDIDSKNIMVYGSFNKLVAGVGIKNLVIDVTDDIILICNKEHYQKVKDVIKKLEKGKNFNYL